MTVTVSATPPTAGIVEEMPNPGMFGGANNNSGFFRNTPTEHISAGQAFINDVAFTVDKITLLYNGANAATLSGAGVQLRLYPVNAGAVTPSGADLVSDTGNLPALSGVQQYVTFDVTNLQLSGGAYYAFVVDLTDAAASGLDAVWINNSNPGSYNNPGTQIRYTFAGSSYVAISDDLVFMVQTVNPQPGDFDADGDVDGADFVAWQTHFPQSINGTLAVGDADKDFDVDGADFVIWQTHFPYTPGPGVVPVPEPMASSFVGLGIFFTMISLRYRNDQSMKQRNGRSNCPPVQHNPMRFIPS